MAKDQLNPTITPCMSTVIRRRGRTVPFAPVLIKDLPRTIRYVASLNGHRSINMIITDALTRALNLDLDRITPGYGSTR